MADSTLLRWMVDLGVRLTDLIEALETSASGEPLSPWCTVPAYAAYRRVGRATVYRWLGKGLPSVGKGKLRRIDRAAADAWLAQDERGQS